MIKTTLIAILLGFALGAGTAQATTTISISIDVPDADAPDVVATLREQFATVAVPVPTQGQLVAALKARLVGEIKAAVKAWRQRQAASGVVEPVAN